MVRRFDWQAVDPQVVLELLKVSYQGDPDAVEALADHDDLPTLVARVFGSPPKSRCIDDPSGWGGDTRRTEAWEVLRKQWLLRSATREQLAEVTAPMLLVSRGGRGVSLTNASQMRSFLRGCRWGRTLKANLLATFISAHKVKKPARTTSTGGARGSVTGFDVVVGQGLRRAGALYPHQVDAIAALDTVQRARTPEHRRALVVLPTGAGKTVTAVTWILQEMRRNPSLRVLWVAHQHELLVQARETFLRLGAHQPLDFTRNLRVISGAHGAVTTLADPNLHIAIATIQSLTSGDWARQTRRLREFTSHRTIVVVDEAHHAGARSYQRLLHALVDQRRITMVGLTATPWPSGAAAERLRATFPVTAIAVDQNELHAAGILSTPVLYTIDTGQSLELDERELRRACGDLPQEVLKRLQTDARDELLVRSWTIHRQRWGKTLVFATSKAHADDLAHRFVKAGADARALHSGHGGERHDILAWFRNQPPGSPCVLISVGMLTEGVDLPDAKSAFLARPTTSRILMRQMIGRVLRGPRAGGTATAHIVYLRDIWTNFDELLEPDELPDLAVATEVAEPSGVRLLPAVRDEATGETISPDILAQVSRMYRRRVGEIPLDPATMRTQLVGYYVTLDQHVPVMEHQVDGYTALIEASVRGEDLRGRSRLSFFDDAYPPYPTERSVAAIADHVRASGSAPDFVPILATVDPREVAANLRAKRALNDQAREKWLMRQYETSLARLAYPTFDHFEEAVERELREIRQAERRGRNASNPERPAPPARRRGPRPDRLRHQTARQLPLRSEVLDLMREHLAGEEVLADLAVSLLPEVSWTRRPVKNVWAYWSLKTSGQAAGRAVIRVNRILQAPRTQVPDDLLEYLMFHELLHHLLPGRGHDAEFRRLEAKWPNADALDLMLDTLHEQFDLARPPRM